MFPPSGPGRYTRTARKSVGSSCTISSLARTQSKVRSGCAHEQTVDKTNESPSRNRFLMLLNSIRGRPDGQQRKIRVFSYISTGIRRPGGGCYLISRLRELPANTG